MDLDHERLDVYHLALDFLVLASEVIEGLPRGRSHLSDQFSRASLSIVLNLAEGAGKHSKPDKRRYYLTARGSATGSAALLDVCCRLHGTPVRRHHKTASTNIRLSFPRRPGPRLSARTAAIFAHFRSSNWSRTIDSPMEHTRHPMESNFPPSGHGHGHGHAYGRT